MKYLHGPAFTGQAGRLQNQENHIHDQYEGQLTGYYDQTERGEKILAVIRRARSKNPEGGRGDQA